MMYGLDQLTEQFPELTPSWKQTLQKYMAHANGPFDGMRKGIAIVGPDDLCSFLIDEINTRGLLICI